MPEDIAAYLTALYGTARAGAVEPRLRSLMHGHFTSPPSIQPGRSWRLPLSQRDAVLISYGDQVREADAPPLRTLGEFLEEHAAGAISAVHVLPFYPSSSDDGFSVVDFRAVDPALGTWDDVCRLGRRFDLMFDAVFNHVSAESDWFQRFLRDEPGYRDWFVTVDGDPDLSMVVRPRALPLLTVFDTAAGSACACARIHALTSRR